MPRRNQIFIPNGYYHIYNRGHNKQSIFLTSKDYSRYLTRLEEYLKKHPVSLMCYCLMPNHIHLIIRQNNEESVERFIHRLHTSYTMYFNKKYDRVGSVFQGRFKAKLIETDEYLLHVSRYVHQNPLEIIHAQGPASKLDNYPWSSYSQYTGTTPHNLCDIKIILNYFSENSLKKQRIKYREFIEAGLKDLDQPLLESISAGDFITLKARP